MKSDESQTTKSKTNESIPWKFWIDTGGTFTDCLAEDPTGRSHRAKVLSNSTIRAQFQNQPSADKIRILLDRDYPKGFFVGFTCTLSNTDSTHSATYRVINWNPDDGELQLDRDWQHSVEAGSLLLLQFFGEAPELAARILTGVRGDQPLPRSQLRLATTRGTNALLERKGGRTVMIINRGLKDLLHIHTQQRPDLFALDIQRPDPLHDRVIEVEFENAVLKNQKPFLEDCKKCLIDGIECAAVVLMHAWKDPAQELHLKQLLQTVGFKYISLSGECVPFIKILNRAETTLANATLSPVLEQYLDSITKAFGEEGMVVMTSAGGLLPRRGYQPRDSLVSGPAGGVVGASRIGESTGFSRIIGFDMGGTSTDVSRYDHALEYQHISKVGDVQIVAPSLRIETVAAGGGSICLYDGNRLRVGPESAGAFPGPACYGTGGPLTVTDVNLLLGRVDPGRFSIPIDVEKSRQALRHLREQLVTAGQSVGADDALLTGLLAIANENMAEAIHKVSTAQGYDPAEYALVAFGGAGGQHACAIADGLGIQTVLYPGNAGLLSAYGLQKAAVERIVDRQCLLDYRDFLSQKDDILQAMSEEAFNLLPTYLRSGAELRRMLISMRLKGQESTIEVDYPIGSGPFDLGREFQHQFEEIYGYRGAPERVEVSAVRVIVGLPSNQEEIETFPESKNRSVSHTSISSFVDNKWISIPVFGREDIQLGELVSGPALIQDAFSTFFVETGWEAVRGSADTIRVSKPSPGNRTTSEIRSEAVKLELFTNRFQTLVENMGVRLQRTALSPNVKERLDFSCALLDREGKLVVNAPHIPVHLGALGTCVRAVTQVHNWNPGDIIVTNHPGFGGSHLPDVTIIAPLFSQQTGEISGFLANRAHHAEMGGISPGSMPPRAKTLEQEGVVIPPTQIMKAGTLDLDKLRILLSQGPYPSRRVEENLADLNAQVASVLKGLSEFAGMETQHGSATLIHYMDALQSRAEQCIRRRLESMADGSYRADQQLDDGSLISIHATVKADTLHIDFTGSSPVHTGNYNATPGIVASAVLYFLRVWIQEPIPLNEGLLKPVTLTLPQGMLNPPFPQIPSECPPVVAGNVETSQRLVDTLFLAFGITACSQGTMNNLIFGNEHTSFYETISGGSGAGPGFNGESGVHVHMTNTGITDPEILEQRFPVKLREFALRTGSGGSGRYRGGDGVIREIEFLEPVTLSLLTQHRIEQPYGLKGGSPGQCGAQYLLHANGSQEKLAGNTTVAMQTGDRIRILTPGGGGWGNLKASGS